MLPVTPPNGMIHHFKLVNFFLSKVIEVDLTATFFVPGKKFYERVKWCLKERMDLKFKFLMFWTNDG